MEAIGGDRRKTFRRPGQRQGDRLALDGFLQPRRITPYGLRRETGSGPGESSVFVSRRQRLRTRRKKVRRNPVAAWHPGTSPPLSNPKRARVLCRAIGKGLSGHCLHACFVAAGGEMPAATV